MREQVVAPLDRRAHRLLPRERFASSPRQESKSIVELLDERADRQRVDAGRRQFDRERNSVEAAADFSDRRRVFRRRCETKVCGARPVDEQLDG